MTNISSSMALQNLYISQDYFFKETLSSANQSKGPPLHLYSYQPTNV